MSATVAAALKKIAVYILTDKKALKGLLETEQRYREKGGKSSLLYKICKR